MILVVAFVVACTVGIIVRGIVLRGLGSMAVAGLNTLVAESYGANSLESHDVRAMGKLQALLQARVESGRLAYAVMVTPEGHVFASTLPAEINTTFPLDDRMRAALDEGRVSVAVTDQSVVEGAPKGRYLQVVGPLQRGEGQHPTGAVLAYRSYDGAASVRNAVATVVGTIMLGSLVACFLLALVSRVAEREIAQSRAELETMEGRLRATTSELEGHTVGTLQALIAAVDAKDHYTARHSLNVADYAKLIAERLDWDVDSEILERAGLLHDVGKIGVRESVLLKPDLLTAEEYTEVQEHSRMGGHIVESIPSLLDVVPAVLYHHERWDGRGYPEGLAGEDIPRAARVLAAADAFDAMTSSRPYRPAISMEKVIAEFEEFSGEQFDPAVAEVVIALIREGKLLPRQSNAA